MTGYLVVLEQSETSWGAYSPDLPGCVVPPPSNAAAVVFVDPAATA